VRKYLCGPWEPLWHVHKQRASCGPHCPRSNYMENGVLLMAVLVSWENLQDEDGALAMSETETRWRGFVGRDREKKVVSQKRGKNKARRERGTIFCSEEGVRDSIRRASLILESETTGWETEPLIFRHHFSFASSLLLPRDGREVNGTPASLTCRENFLKQRK